MRLQRKVDGPSVSLLAGPHVFPTSCVAETATAQSDDAAKVVVCFSHLGRKDFSRRRKRQKASGSIAEMHDSPETMGANRMKILLIIGLILSAYLMMPKTASAQTYWNAARYGNRVMSTYGAYGNRVMSYYGHPRAYGYRRTYGYRRYYQPRI